MPVVPVLSYVLAPTNAMFVTGPDTLTGWVIDVLAPPLSVTVRVTDLVPPVEYVFDAVGDELAAWLLPSPKVHA